MTNQTVGVAQFKMIGNVVRDVELKTHANKSNYVLFTLAVDSDTGPTEFFPVSAVGPLARRAALMLKKGSRIEAKGKITPWTKGEKSGFYFNVTDIDPLARCNELPPEAAAPERSSAPDTDSWLSDYDAAMKEYDERPQPPARSNQMRAKA
ncbi:single-stranded DNA-binding protein [Herbaspirillum huttiense]|uniref:single-stranded DNA-binding protein n=1 Tax=Herbaspirillum huttiense TaxID=863372 RepID=UPI002176DA12|nr:single-stranded DNA-binding protein [Herbaspirillum huttiense]UWE19317.1 single-stranded DNA-binding protein [Herbaspirillum huttiense]